MMKSLQLFLPLLVFLSSQIIRSSNSSSPRCEVLAKKRSKDKPLPLKYYLGEFGRSGWPQEELKRRINSSVTLTCNHIGYYGKLPRAPPVALQWFKDGKTIKKITGKIDTYGCNRRPFLLDSGLSISKLDVNDRGNYSCQIRRLNAKLSEKYILSLNFKLVVEDDGKTDDTIGGNSSKLSLQNIDSGEEERSWSGKVIWLVSLSFLLLTIVLIVLWNSTRVTGCHCRNHDNSSEVEEDDYMLSEFKKETKKIPANHIATFNLDNYRRFFPFITEDEWMLLQQTQVSRSSVHCDVEHSMPIVLGTGNFGHVYKGELSQVDGSSRVVAVKRLNSGFKIEELASLLVESVTMLKCGRHDNVICLIGSILLDTLDETKENDLKKPPILLLEYAGEGNLKKYLQNQQFRHSSDTMTRDSRDDVIKCQRYVSMKDLTSFAYQAARGMQHLASRKIVHRDLAARNVLLTSDGVIKIADFGLSKRLRNTQQDYYKMHSSGIAPAKWTALEALTENKFSSKSDVWSYGVLLWEIYSLGELPYQGFSITKLHQHLLAGMRLPKPEIASHGIYQLMLQCWALGVDTRPTFSDIVAYFDKLLTNMSKNYVELGSADGDVIQLMTSSRGDSALTSLSGYSSMNNLTTTTSSPATSGRSSCASSVRTSTSDYFSLTKRRATGSDVVGRRKRRFRSPIPFIDSLSNPIYGEGGVTSSLPAATTPKRRLPDVDCRHDDGGSV